VAEVVVINLVELVGLAALELDHRYLLRQELNMR
jgi:hypothetical protein